MHPKVMLRTSCIITHINGIHRAKPPLYFTRESAEERGIRIVCLQHVHQKILAGVQLLVCYKMSIEKMNEA